MCLPEGSINMDLPWAVQAICRIEITAVFFLEPTVNRVYIFAHPKVFN